MSVEPPGEAAISAPRARMRNSLVRTSQLHITFGSHTVWWLEVHSPAPEWSAPAREENDQHDDQPRRHRACAGL